MEKQKLSVHINYLHILIDTVAEFNISKTDFIRTCQVPQSLLDDVSYSENIKFSEWIKIISRLLDFAPDKAIGYKFGLNCQVTSHGALGFAMISNNTLANAIIDLQKYASMRLHKMELKIFKKKDKIAISFLPLYHLPKEIKVEKRELINKFFMEAALVNVIKNLQAVTDFEITGINIDVEWEIEKYHHFFEKRLPRFNFNKEQNQIIFDLKCLDFPLKFSFENAYQIALNLLKEESMYTSGKDNKITSLVNKNLILTPHKGFPTLSETAKKINISQRALKRKLELENTCYTSLIQSKKLLVAKKLISANKSLQEISDILGYSNASSFTRAFVGWTGKNPSKFIKESNTLF
ncbi:hypothetical protein F889_00708 [Acinetobacter colistiniresistens]|uniref:HTH araC/xylS-type domain-containing protein n=2 Tax=Acinetobacter colistiniresistens TaxID=280145 RepID=N9PQB7_9GAMM|nr:hypothetical protein F889_00708 [Acinetobacter colistiniresistens]